MVLNTNDSGPYSLRSVISNAAPGQTITFASNLSGATILLTSGELLLNQNVTIDASSLAGGVQINGNANDRVLEVTNNAIVILNSLTVTNGYAGADGSGGGIYNPWQSDVEQLHCGRELGILRPAAPFATPAS